MLLRSLTGGVYLIIFLPSGSEATNRKLTCRLSPAADSLKGFPFKVLFVIAFEYFICTNFNTTLRSCQPFKIIFSKKSVTVALCNLFEILPAYACRVKNVKRSRILFYNYIFDSRVTAGSVALVKVKISRSDLGKITHIISFAILDNAIILEVTHADTLAELSDI